MKNTLRLIFAMVILTIVLSSMSSCRKDSIPEIDTIPPSISIAINGPGINRTINNENDELYQFNLLAGGEYSFVMTMVDTGGCEELHAQVLTDLLPHNVKDALTGTTLTPRINGIATYYDLINTGSPITGLIITGKITAPTPLPQHQDGYTIRAYGADYGSNGGTPNTTSTTMLIMVEAGGNPQVLEF